MDLSFDSFVLTASTADLADEPAARDTADALEFRMDLATDALDALDAYEGALPILATNRAEWEGGESIESERDRLAALVAAADHDAVAAIDIELATLKTDLGAEVADRVRERDATVVASIHDFERTPARSELTRLLREAAHHGDVGKLAVTAQTKHDALKLLEVTERATTWGDRVATIAMGEPGRHTRAVAPVYGSKIGYAPVNPKDATAPGQYDLETLRSLVRGLSSNPDV
ncbi:type I 3-dehydroquinate dehydratase [Haloferax sp. DFSO60]|uniref:type I 3-dehydroquinate dehydratase n=1 Tax=Haloferax sp. DFSO60 TaxID=3388652 RepID=UPI00397D8295